MNMAKTKSDRKLVKAAKTGDLSAFSELTERCRPEIMVELTGLTGNIHDAEDVLQEAFLRSFLKLSSLKEPYNFGGWVRLIARNIARNRLRREPKFVQLQENFAEGRAEVNTDDGSLQTELALLALSRLSPKLRETTRLTYLSNYSQKQVAARLGIPLGTVKRRLWESRIKMRKEVMSMSRTGRTPESVNTVPVIKIRDLPGEEMTVHAVGPGLYFSTVLKEGHEEICQFFDYPGGILTQIAHSQVVRKTEVFGRKCFEVLIDHSDCEPPIPNVLQYFTLTDNGFSWVMMTTADEAYPQTRFMKEGEEIFPLSYSSGENEEYSARAVELTVGNINYGHCLAVFWSWQNGTPAESFFTLKGRQVLHRRYAGPEAPESQNYQYENLPEEGAKVFRGTEYRLWYDTVLLQS
ncbi:MAG: sigma-70 family RNA polymerase sigma factor [Candidatus Sabulitectum sp.]|nr:sigma-70 family RNA polymerase sigma factor [Candidatus Sabulitectum sp.]